MTTATAIRERPILFSAPMVRAILDGRKTQTRRVIVPQPEREPSATCGVWYPKTTAKKKVHYANESHFVRGVAEDFCPYGAPGDRLWVREAFQPIWAHPDEPRDWQTGEGYKIVYVATEGRQDWWDEEDGLTNRVKPGIHMPRWASRITLEVVRVRVERVQDISEADAIAEGLEKTGHGTWRAEVGSPARVEARDAYEDLWDSINAKRGHGWDANPWVWVVEFKVLTGGPKS